MTIHDYKKLTRKQQAMLPYVAWSELADDAKARILDCPKSNQPTLHQQQSNAKLFRIDGGSWRIGGVL